MLMLLYPSSVFPAASHTPTSEEIHVLSLRRSPPPVITRMGTAPEKPLARRVRDSRLWLLCMTFVSVRTLRPWRYRGLMAILALLSFLGLHHHGHTASHIIGLLAMAGMAALISQLFWLGIQNQRNQRLDRELVIQAFLILVWGILLATLPAF